MIFIANIGGIMIIHFIRHGLSKANVNSEYSRPDVDLIDIEGTIRPELEDAKTFVKEHKVDRYIVSPYLRAIRTAEYLGIKEYEIDERIREVDMGIITGLTETQAIDKHPDLMKNFFQDRVNYRLPQGESMLDVYKRVSNFLNDLSDEEGEIIVVSHYVAMISAASWTVDNINLSESFSVNNGGRLTIKKTKDRKCIVFD